MAQVHHEAVGGYLLDGCRVEANLPGLSPVDAGYRSSTAVIGGRAVAFCAARSARYSG